MPAGWGTGSHPLPPANGQVISPLYPGTFDLRWDDPSLLAANSEFTIVGVNVYRADSCDRGPYHRINSYPVAAPFYRDRTDVVTIQEPVQESAWVYRGDSPNDRRWVFRTVHPIAKPGNFGPYGKPTYANSPVDVQVYVDGVEVPVAGVFGNNGEVTLIDQPTLNVATEKFEGPLLPTGSTSAVTITYGTYRNFVASGLDVKLFYRLTTVVLDPSTPSGLLETPLAYCEPLTSFAVETLDYIWREAVRRNQWILQQGGERVKVYLRRTSGIPCDCRMDPRTRAFQRQPSNRCPVCFGVGFVGGYDGPIDILVAPDDAERRISQSPFGRRKEHTYEVWTGPSPMLTQRDFIVKQTNERYSIGPVRRPNNRGNILQQHFNLAYFDEQDIRYRVPVDGVANFVYPQTRTTEIQLPSLPNDGNAPQETLYLPDAGAPYPVGPQENDPQITDKSNIPPERQVRGRTPVWENIEY